MKNLSQELVRPRTIGGRMVRTPYDKAPYKAVLSYEDGTESEHPFNSLKEGEAFIRRETPALPPPSRVEPSGMLLRRMH